MARRRLEDWLDALRAVDPGDPGAKRLIAEALGSGHAHAVARAAKLVGEHRIEGLQKVLLATFEGLFDEPVARDPGCVGKVAIADALDLLDHLDPTPFWRGARHVQLEPAWGEPVDTAPPLRNRCAAALVRLYEPGALDLLADHLVDDQVAVRAQAALTLGTHGGPGAAALLRLKIRVGDKEDEVTEAALGSLLSLSPDAGLELGSELLGEDRLRMRQLAGLALGASRVAGALPVLLAWMGRAGVRAERQAAYVALGLLRSVEARDVLLDVVATGAAPDANAAIEALAIQRGDPGVEAAVRAAATRSRHDLSRALAEWFGP